MLFAGRVEGKVILYGGLAVVGIIVLIIYLPVALIREATRAEDDELPEWMGTVRGRRARLRVIFSVLGVLAAMVGVLAVWGD
jgi:hypothetical protein